MSFGVEFSPPAREHLRAERKRDQQIIMDAIEARLIHRPDHPTRQVKKLDDNELAPWELRVGDFRVFYDIDRDNDLVVIIAIGHKSHNILRVGGKEIDL